MTLMLINIVSCSFLREWIVDILKNRFNRIYNDSCIHAIKHFCGRIDLFTTAWKSSSNSACFLQKLAVWVTANAFKIIPLSFFIGCLLLVSISYSSKYLYTCKTLISKVNSLVLELSREDNISRNFIQKLCNLLIFWTVTVEAKFLFRLFAVTTINSNSSSSLWKTRLWFICLISDQ